MQIIAPKAYKTDLGIIETQVAIKNVKDFFENSLSRELDLTRVSSPLFVLSNTGINDNLNGVESPISFEVPYMNKNAEIVHSLAKWKRIALKEYGFVCGRGIYTDMNAIRKDEELDNLHSIYVDQWDWEAIIEKEDRNEDTLKSIVRKIYKVFKETETYVSSLYPSIKRSLPEDIYFITTQELEDKYPDLTPKERENSITREYGAVFVMKVGNLLNSGQKHDGRSPDYDDWELNGDILFYNEVLDIAFELSSMGIRVDEDSLTKQLKISGCEDRKNLKYHKMLLEGELPYAIGGGIGQSRICMYFLRKAHIGEVQVGLWPEDMISECRELGINLL